MPNIYNWKTADREKLVFVGSKWLVVVSQPRCPAERRGDIISGHATYTDAKNNARAGQVVRCTEWVEAD